MPKYGWDMSEENMKSTKGVGDKSGEDGQVMRLASVGDAKQIIDLHNKAYEDHRKPEYWIWEYTSIYPDKAVFTVYEDKGRVFGTQGMIPIYLNIAGERQLTGKSEMSLLDSDYRGGTYFKDQYAFAMEACAEKGMSVVWGFTPAVKVWRNKLGFEVVEGAMHDAVAIINSGVARLLFKKANWSPVKRAFILITSIFAAMYCGLRTALKDTPEGDYEVVDKPKDWNDIRNMYERLFKDNKGSIYIDQDETYVKWRIYDNPKLKYTTFFAYKGDKLVAYAYYNMLKDKVANLTDLTYTDEGAAKLLLKRIIGDLKRQKAGYLKFYGNMNNPQMARTFALLKGFGFVVKRNPAAIVLKNISYPDKELVYDTKNWYMGGLWTEGYNM